MSDIIMLPDDRLEYIEHEMDATGIKIYARAIRMVVRCPCCGAESDKVHSRYTRKLQDLPIQGKKVRLFLENNKYFCPNKACARKTFVPQFDFFARKATRTNRLQDEILRLAVTQSSVSAAKYLRNGVADIGKSSVCNLLKKTRENA